VLLNYQKTANRQTNHWLLNCLKWAFAEVYFPVIAIQLCQFHEYDVNKCFDTVGWATGRAKTFDVGLLLMMIWLELCTSYSSSCHHSPPPSSLALIKSRMETFWHRLTQVHLENGCYNGDGDVTTKIFACDWSEAEHSVSFTREFFSNRSLRSAARHRPDSTCLIYRCVNHTGMIWYTRV